MQRSLGAFETALMLTGERDPFNVVIVLRLAGGPSRELLKAALATLQSHHPLLRVHVLKRDDRYFFDPQGTPAIPLRLVERKNGEVWRRIAEDELNRHLDVASGPAMRCTYLPPTAPNGNCEILTTLNHVTIDACSTFTLLRQLLTLCHPEGGSLGPPDSDLAAPAEDLFPAAFRGLRRYRRILGFTLRQMSDETLYRIRSRNSARPLIHDSARCRLLSLQLSEEMTARLVRHTRRERVTLSSACSAAMLIAVHRHLYSNRSVSMRHFTFADLRPYLHPAIAPESLGCYISMLRYTTPMETGCSFWPLTHAVSSQVAQSLRRGDRFCAAWLSPTMMRMVLGQRKYRMGTTAISYIGARHLDQHFGSIRVRGVHGYISNIPLGPQYTAQVRIFARRLCWDIVYLDADLDVSQAGVIANEIVETLTAATAEE